MELSQRLEQILRDFRPVFSREASFRWFVLLVWGILLNTQPAAVTSYVNALGLGEAVYQQALYWFESSAFSVKGLCQHWGQWLSQHRCVYRIKGERVYVADGIKVAKEGRKMPGVKRLHQESEDVSKPQWIRGHYFNGLSILLSAGGTCFAVPLILRLQDGLMAQSPSVTPKRKGKKATLVTKMADLCTSYANTGSYVVLDSYFACAPVLKRFRRHCLHLISRVRCSTVAHAPFSVVPISTDLTLSGAEKIAAYGLRFKIEVTFRTLVHLLGGFAYRFWLKAMTMAPTWPSNLNLADYPPSLQAQILAKVEAFERFLNLNAMALGLLQILALECPCQVWSHFPRWFRTLPKHGYPSERIAQLALQHHVEEIFLKSPSSLLLPKFIANKLDSSTP